MKIRMTSGQCFPLDDAEYPVVGFAQLSRKEEDTIIHRVTIYIRSNGTDYLSHGTYHFRGENVSLEAFSGCEGWSPYTTAEGLRNQLADAGFLRPFISRLIRDVSLDPNLTRRS